MKLRNVMIGSGLTMNMIPVTATAQPMMKTIQSNTVFSLILKKLMSSKIPTRISTPPTTLTKPEAISSPFPAKVPMKKISPRKSITISSAIVATLYSLILFFLGVFVLAMWLFLAFAGCHYHILTRFLCI